MQPLNLEILTVYLWKDLKLDVIIILAQDTGRILKIGFAHVYESAVRASCLFYYFDGYPFIKLNNLIEIAIHFTIHLVHVIPT